MSLSKNHFRMIRAQQAGRHLQEAYRELDLTFVDEFIEDFTAVRLTMLNVIPYNIKNYGTQNFQIHAESVNKNHKFV